MKYFMTRYAFYMSNLHAAGSFCQFSGSTLDDLIESTIDPVAGRQDESTALCKKLRKMLGKETGADTDAVRRAIRFRNYLVHHLTHNRQTPIPRMDDLRNYLSNPPC